MIVVRASILNDIIYKLNNAICIAKWLDTATAIVRYIYPDPETRPAWGYITEIPLHVMSICAGLRYSEC